MEYGPPCIVSLIRIMSSSFPSSSIMTSSSSIGHSRPSVINHLHPVPTVLPDKLLLLLMISLFHSLLQSRDYFPLLLLVQPFSSYALRWPSRCQKKWVWKQFWRRPKVIVWPIALKSHFFVTSSQSRCDRCQIRNGNFFCQRLFHRV